MVTLCAGGLLGTRAPDGVVESFAAAVGYAALSRGQTDIMVEFMKKGFYTDFPSARTIEREVERVAATDMAAIRENFKGKALGLSVDGGMLMGHHAYIVNACDGPTRHTIHVTSPHNNTAIFPKGDNLQNGDKLLLLINRRVFWVQS